MAAVAKLTIWAGDFGRINGRFGSYRADNGDLIFTFLLGQWFRYLTGFADLLGAVLLFVPKWSRYGAILLACSVGLGTLISITVLRGNPTWGTPEMVLVPLVLTLLAIGLVVMSWSKRSNPGS